MPLISVIIPSYNYDKFIKNTINSLLSQTITDFEIIVIDDKSTDSSISIINSIKDKRIKLFLNDKNLGVSKTVFNGQKLAQGKYLCLLAADDTLPINSLELRLNQLIKSNSDLVHTGITRIEGEKTLYIPPLDTSKKENIISFLNGNKNKFGINSSTFLYKKALLKKIGFRDISKKFSPHDDYEFSLRLLSHSSSTFINKNSYNYNIHENSHIKKYGNTKEANKKFIKLVNDYISIFKATSKL